MLKKKSNKVEMPGYSEIVFNTIILLMTAMLLSCFFSCSSLKPSEIKLGEKIAEDMLEDILELENLQTHRRL